MFITKAPIPPHGSSRRRRRSWPAVAGRNDSGLDGFGANGSQANAAYGIYLFSARRAYGPMDANSRR